MKTFFSRKSYQCFEEINYGENSRPSFLQDSDEDDDGNITDFEKERKALGQTLVKIFDKQNKSYVTEEDFKSASVQQLKVKLSDLYLLMFFSLNQFVPGLF